MPVTPVCQVNLRFFLQSDREFEEGYAPGTKIHGEEEDEEIPCPKTVVWP